MIGGYYLQSQGPDGTLRAHVGRDPHWEPTGPLAPSSPGLMPELPTAGTPKGQESPSSGGLLSRPIAPRAPHTPPAADRHPVQDPRSRVLPQSATETGKPGTRRDGQSQGIGLLTLVQGSQGARHLAEAPTSFPAPERPTTLSTSWHSDEDREIPRGQEACPGSCDYTAAKPPFGPRPALPTAQALLRQALPETC